jgi:hypothetical protein
MFDSFIEYVSKASPDEVRALSVEDMAICVTWFQSYAGTPVRQETCDGLQNATDLWVREWELPNHESEGSRQQPLLRVLMDEVLGGQFANLARDELDLLCVAYDLMQRAQRAGSFERPINVLRPHIDTLQRRRAGLPSAPGLPTLSERIFVTVAEHIQAARPREVRLLAGIPLPCRGPVFICKGSLKVIDFVPENCTVVVEQGACYVSGFVLGRVLATKHCEVRENISGVTIVTNGDVRVRNIINNALIVAKSGHVRCRNAHSPRLVFGGESIRIAESAVGGRYISPRIEALQEIVDGEVHVAQSLTAGRFRCSKAAPVVVLRKELSCEDYGEEVRPEARKFFARRAEIKRRLHSLDRMVAFAEQENEHAANCALMFICGGEETKRILEELQAAQRRQAFLDRIITGLLTLRETVETAAALQATPDQTDSPAAASPMEDLEQELKDLEFEGQVDVDLAEKGEEVLAFGRDLQRKAPEAGVVGSVCARLLRKEVEWVGEREQLAAFIREKDEELRRIVGSMEILERNDDISRTQLLGQLLTMAKQRPSGDELASRLDSSFVRMLLRAINHRIERTRRYKSAIESVREELRQINSRLRKDWQIPVRDEEGPAVLSRVIGQFDEGVRICADCVISNPSEAAPGAMIITADSRGKLVTYVRKDEGIVPEG